MNKSWSIILAGIFMAMPVKTQTTRLIVRADDLGSSHSANEAILISYKEGIITTVEMMVPAPWFPEAVKLLKENPDLDAGIHLTLTSEWENIKWRPLTICPSLTDKNGYFFPMIHPNKNYPGQAILENHWDLAEIEKEFRTQIEMALRNIPWISHLSSHMGCSDFAPEVATLVKRLAEEYKIGYSFKDADLNYVGFDGPSKTSAEKIQSFLNMLNKLEPGKSYIFVDHPGLANEELKAVYHIGYEQVADDRQGVTDVFTNKKVKELIRQRGIQLISYKDLR